MVYLLIAILLVIVVGLGFSVAILYDIRADQRRGEAATLHYLRSIFGGPFDGDVARLLSDFSEFYSDIKSGRYPQLRRDDCYPRKADYDRWEATEMQKAYCGD